MQIILNCIIDARAITSVFCCPGNDQCLLQLGPNGGGQLQLGSGGLMLLLLLLLMLLLLLVVVVILLLFVGGGDVVILIVVKC